MKKLKTILIMICAVLMLCLTSNAPPIFANELNSLPPPIRNLQVTNAKQTPPTPTPTPTSPVIEQALPPVAVPPAYQSDKFVQLILATAQYQTERAAEANRQLTETRAQLKEVAAARDEWKTLFFDERKATDKLQIALAESRSESSNLQTGLAVANNQRELDKNFISDQQKEIKTLRRARWKYAAVGFLGGFATGVPTGGLLAVKFNF